MDARWLVIEGNAEFFRVTKRIHNMLHGSPGDGLGLGPADEAAYGRTLAGAVRSTWLRGERIDLTAGSRGRLLRRGD